MTGWCRDRSEAVVAVVFTAACAPSLGGGPPEPSFRQRESMAESDAPPSRSSERDANRPEERSGAYPSPPALEALALPQSDTLEPVPDNIVPVVVSSGGLWLGLDLIQVLGSLPGIPAQAIEGVGLENKTSRASSYILPLAAAAKSILCGTPDPPRTATLFADGRLPLRTIVDVVHTLGHGFDSVLLGVSNPGATENTVGVLPVRLSAEKDVRSGVTLSASDSGLNVSNRHGSWQGSGCARGGSAPTLRRAAGAWPLEAIEACVRTLHEGTTDRVTLVAPAEITFAEVVTLARAARRGLGTTALFTELALVVGPAAESTGPLGETPDGGREGHASPEGSRRQDRMTRDAAGIASIQDGFRACYEAELATNPRATGKVVVSLDVNGSGSVESVRVEPRGVLAPIHDCLRSAAASALFEPSEEGPVTIRVPLHFVPGAAESAQSSASCWRDPPPAE